MGSTLGQANEKEDEIDFHAANNCVSPSNTIRTGGDLVAIPFEPRLLDQQLPGGQKRHRQHRLDCGEYRGGKANTELYSINVSHAKAPAAVAIASHNEHSSDCVVDLGIVGKVTSSVFSLVVKILPGGVYELK